MLKVGITGGIGTGKSTVCMIFNALRVPTFNADIKAKELYNTNAELRSNIKNRFGESMYEAGLFQKNRLAEIVFNDAEALKDLNSIVHPLVLQQSENWFSSQNTQYAIKEAALLIESGSYKKMDKIILVQASKEVRIERILRRDNTTHEEVEKRMQKQLPEKEKEKFADYLIQNNADDFLIEQVMDIHKKILTL
jgi:dephospho-CoA kinase